MDILTARLRAYQDEQMKAQKPPLFDHLAARIKSESSMRQKCRRKQLPETAHSALRLIRDAIGIRIICRFIDDIYQLVEYIRQLPGYTLTEEKDYIRQAKPNGYRSYHMILETSLPGEPESYFIEVQLRTIAMDTWASLEHEMKYKHTVQNTEIITRELKRCADELASCDVSMQTIRRMIQQQKGDAAL